MVDEQSHTHAPIDHHDQRERPPRETAVAAPHAPRLRDPGNRKPRQEKQQGGKQQAQGGAPGSSWSPSPGPRHNQLFALYHWIVSTIPRMKSG